MATVQDVKAWLGAGRFPNRSAVLDDAAIGPSWARAFLTKSNRCFTSCVRQTPTNSNRITFASRVGRQAGLLARRVENRTGMY
jgi:hypothetical protein